MSVRGDVTAATPSGWNPPGYFPQSPAGNNLPAVVIVDGVTVTVPLLDALGSALIDVPLILTTMRNVRRVCLLVGKCRSNDVARASCLHTLSVPPSCVSHRRTTCFTVDPF